MYIQFSWKLRSTNPGRYTNFFVNSPEDQSMFSLLLFPFLLSIYVGETMGKNWFFVCPDQIGRNISWTWKKGRGSGKQKKHGVFPEAMKLPRSFFLPERKT